MMGVKNGKQEKEAAVKYAERHPEVRTLASSASELSEAMEFIGLENTLTALQVAALSHRLQMKKSLGGK